ncbi:MAG: hypothetical protein AAFW98_06030, partial [Pseudomonadota bacterium]
IVFSSTWVTDLRARVPSADARLIRYAGPQSTRPVLEAVAVEKVGDAFYRISITAQNFMLTSFPNPYWDGFFQGHAHVYGGGYKIATLYSDEAIIGPIPDGVESITVTLMNPLHCYVVTTDGVLLLTVGLQGGHDELLDVES